MMTTIQLTPADRYTIVQLHRGKANAINQTMVDELRAFFADAATNPAIEGVVLTGQPHFFSAGVDLPEVYHYDSAGIRHFWGSFIQLAADMVAFPKPLVAAITGHSPAGGCIMACACDYRVMAEGPRYQIGLNEMAVGIAPRASILELYAFWIGRKRAYHNLLEGNVMNGAAALDIGLVDVLVPLEETLAVAEHKMQAYLKLPQLAFQQTKKALRRSVVDAMRDNFEADLDLLHQQLMSEESRQMMGQIVAQLSQRKV